MSLHPWTIGEQTLRITAPDGSPPDAPPLVVAFSHDPNDAALKRLRVGVDDGKSLMCEVELRGNGSQQSVIWQPVDRKAWDRSLPAVEWVDGSPVHPVPMGSPEAATPFTADEVVAYNTLAKLYHQPLLPSPGEDPAAETEGKPAEKVKGSGGAKGEGSTRNKKSDT